MSYADLRDFTAEYATTTEEGLSIQVEKLGGGTLGKAYTGTWRYIVDDVHGTELSRAQDLQTGRPRGHRYVALLIADYFAGWCESRVAEHWDVVYYPAAKIGTVAHEFEPAYTLRFHVTEDGVAVFADELSDQVVNAVQRWITSRTS